MIVIINEKDIKKNFNFFNIFFIYLTMFSVISLSKSNNLISKYFNYKYKLLSTISLLTISSSLITNCVQLADYFHFIRKVSYSISFDMIVMFFSFNLSNKYLSEIILLFSEYVF